MAGEVRIERLLPRDIESAVAASPVVYLPLGTYEWHGQHLPVGLDALTAYGVCCRAARRDGGLVCPPLYYGTGGGHALYPWNVMMEDDDAIAALLSKTMHRMQAFGIRLLILFSGHFAPAQLAMIAPRGRRLEPRRTFAPGPGAGREHGARSAARPRPCGHLRDHAAPRAAPRPRRD